MGCELNSQPYLLYCFCGNHGMVEQNVLKSSREKLQKEGGELVTDQQNDLGNSCLRNVSLERMSRVEQAQPLNPGQPMFRTQGLGLVLW